MAELNKKKPQRRRYARRTKGSKGPSGAKIAEIELRISTDSEIALLEDIIFEIVIPVLEDILTSLTLLGAPPLSQPMSEGAFQAGLVFDAAHGAADQGQKPPSDIGLGESLQHRLSDYLLTLTNLAGSTVGQSSPTVQKRLEGVSPPDRATEGDQSVFPEGS